MAEPADYRAVLLVATGASPTTSDIESFEKLEDVRVLPIALLAPAPAAPRVMANRGRALLGRAYRMSRRRAGRLARRLGLYQPVSTDAGAAPPKLGRNALRIRREAEEVMLALSEEPAAAMIVALDTHASTVAWHVVQRRPDILAVAGLDAALRILDGSSGAIDLSPRVTLIDSVHSFFAALPDLSPRGPRVLIVGDGAADASRLRVAVPQAEVMVLKQGPGSCVSLLPSNAGVMVEAPAPDATANGSGYPSAVRAIQADVILTAGTPMLDIEDAVAVSLPHPQAGCTSRVRLLIGPANYAGQGAAWSRAIERADPTVVARNLAVVQPTTPFTFPADVTLTTRDWTDVVLRGRAALQVLATASHVLVESMRPLFGLEEDAPNNAWDVEIATREIAALVASGRQVGLIFHGSEARQPSVHADLYPDSPFAVNEFAEERLRRTAVTDTVHRAIAGMDLPRFVTTPDMLDFVPDATWIPVVVSPGAFVPGRPLLAGRRPVVLHAPSSGPLKGSSKIDSLLERLAEDDMIEYRRLNGVPPSLVSSHLRDCDLLIDQIVLGNLGVLAAQAMACGRVVIAHVPDRVRDRYDDHVPVVEATPGSLEEVLYSLLADHAAFARIGAEGVRFVRRHHDGRRSASRLLEFVDTTNPVTRLSVAAGSGE